MHGSTRPLYLLAAGLTGLMGLMGLSAPSQAGPAHLHGQATLDIAVEARGLTLRLEIPQDSLLGHERTPRTAAEQQAAAAAIQRLRDGARLFMLPAERGCTLAGVEIEAPRLQPGAAAAGASGHADVDATYRFDCVRTEGLRNVDVGGLFDAFARLHQIQAQVASADGQHQARVKRPARALAWGR
jgi:hypothetical protein